MSLLPKGLPGCCAKGAFQTKAVMSDFSQWCQNKKLVLGIKVMALSIN